MKRILPSAIMLFMFNNLFAQEDVEPIDGLYFKAAFGGVSRGLTYIDKDKETGTEYAKGNINGYGIILNLQLGHRFFKKNHVLTGDLNLSKIKTSKVTGDIGFFTPDVSLTMYEFNYGVTYTYYFLPSNFYISGNAALSIIGIVRGNEQEVSNYGYSGAIETGKTWWNYNRTYGFGVSASYRFTQTKTGYKDSEEILRSQPISIAVHFILQ